MRCFNDGCLPSYAQSELYGIEHCHTTGYDISDGRTAPIPSNAPHDSTGANLTLRKGSAPGPTARYGVISDGTIHRGTCLTERGFDEPYLTMHCHTHINDGLRP